MRTILTAALATAAIGTASLLAVPAQAAPLNPLAQTQASEPLAAWAQYPGGFARPPVVHYGEHRGRAYYGTQGAYGRPYGYDRSYGYGRPYAYDRRYYDGRRYYRRGNSGAAAAAGIAGLATGAIIGGALAQQRAPVYVAPNDQAVAYCIQRFRSYDPASGTYLGYDGRRHACP